MEEYDSPGVRRFIIPSPLRGTPSPSKDVRTLYSSQVPPFMLEALERASSDEFVDLPKHYLPDFPVRMVGGFPNPTTSEFREIASHFPGCTAVSYMAPFLTVSWPSLPVKPWPLTLGGMPLFYTALETEFPPTFGRAGGGSRMMRNSSQKLHAWERPDESLMRQVLDCLITDGINLRYFGWCGTRWYAEVVSPSDGERLPSTICGLLCLWKVYKEYEEGARRIITPDGGTIFDTTCYTPDLRPGIRIESSGGKSCTFGIPLVGSDGRQWISVANHCFSNIDEDVHHPNFGRDGNDVVVTVKLSFPIADIALAQLKPGLTYSTTSFDGEENNGTKLEGLVPSKDVPLVASLFLDSAFNGKCKGLVVGIGFKVLPEEFPEELPVGYRYIHTNMVYFGNGANDVFPGTCGNAMWTEDNEVASFFRFYVNDNAVAYAPTVDILIDKGYKLQAIL